MAVAATAVTESMYQWKSMNMPRQSKAAVMTFVLHGVQMVSLGK